MNIEPKSTDSQSHTSEQPALQVKMKTHNRRESLAEISKSSPFFSNMKQLPRSGSTSRYSQSPDASPLRPSRLIESPSPSTPTTKLSSRSSMERTPASSSSLNNSTPTSVSPSPIIRSPQTLNPHKPPSQPQHSYSSSLVISLQRRLEKEQVKLDGTIMFMVT